MCTRASWIPGNHLSRYLFRAKNCTKRYNVRKTFCTRRRWSSSVAVRSRANNSTCICTHIRAIIRFLLLFSFFLSRFFGNRSRSINLARAGSTIFRRAGPDNLFDLYFWKCIYGEPENAAGTAAATLFCQKRRGEKNRFRPYNNR